MLRQFDEVVPGLAREIADAADAEQKHRHQWENKALWNDIFVESGGLLLGWILAGLCVAAGAFLAWKGNNIGAGILIGPPLVAMVRTIIHNGRHRDANVPTPSSRAQGGQPPPSSKKTNRGRNR
jgi:uncharacterized membrane protein